MKKRNSIKTRIIGILFLCFLLPFLFQVFQVTTSVNALVEEKIIKTAYKSLENSALHISNILQTQFDMAWYYKNYISVEEAANQLSSAGEKQLYMLQSDVNTRLVSENNIERFSFPFYYIIMDYKGNMMTNYTYSPHGEYNMTYKDLSKNEWYKNLKDSYTDETFMFTHKDFLSTSGTTKFYVASNIMNKDNVGILLIGVDENSIASQITDVLPEGSVFIVSENGDCLVSSVDSNLKYSPEIYQKYTAKQEELKTKEMVTITLNGSEYALMSKNVVVKGFASHWQMISIVPLQNITGELTKIKITNSIVLGFYILAIIWVILLLNRNIVAPILSLCISVGEVTRGNLKAKIDHLPNNEFGELGKGFNEMVKKLEQYFLEIRRSEEKKRETEIRLLQNQIKPHFVRNVLNTIRWLAEINGATSVGESVMAFSSLLEYNFKDISLLSTVGDEVNYVRKYIYLQKLRFQNKFRDEYYINEEIMALPMLKLSFQPIVENSIYHGLLEKEGLGTIVIAGEIRDDILVFTVSDDGAGMPPEKVQAVLEPPKSDEIMDATNSTENIALWNIDQRIKKQYGENYGLSIESTEGQGTKVTIRFPVIKEFGQHDKNTDS